MVAEYQNLTGLRRCAQSGRELKPGERYFGVLLDEGGRLSRRDFGPECWSGAPDAAIGFWWGKIPASDAPCRLPVDDELVLECFRRLADAVEPEQLAIRYVLALLLMRKRTLRLDDTRRDDDGEVMHFRVAKGGERFEVRDPGLTDEQLTAAQAEVFRLMGWD